MERLLFALVAAVLVSPCSGDHTKFCHGQPCPEYTVVETNENFEKRSYVATSWASTPVEGEDASDLLAAFSRLKAFWDKQKKAGKPLPDSWPVLITRRKAGGADALSLSWFLPPGSEPEFSDTSVQLEHRAAGTVYVKSFTGTPSLDACQDIADNLKNALTTAGIAFDSQTSTGAFYDSYYSIIHYNEMWFQ
uniref:Uncharacterized protein n=1 Tax=Kryptolebias marmoratus TaxID=37003 RepID=A0A3Q3B6P6_KRYMA